MRAVDFIDEDDVGSCVGRVQCLIVWKGDGENGEMLNFRFCHHWLRFQNFEFSNPKENLCQTRLFETLKATALLCFMPNKNVYRKSSGCASEILRYKRLLMAFLGTRSRILHTQVSCATVPTLLPKLLYR